MNFMYFLAILIGPLVKILYSFIGNYAVTMVVATLLLKLLLFPLSIHQQKSSAKMAVFQPLMNEIQQKYKNDPQKQQEELMKLQQEHGFNPMGGCLPMLLTMLVLFGFLGVVYYPYTTSSVSITPPSRLRARPSAWQPPMRPRCRPR